jgi:predicted RNA-binding Zn-ribbon protein involved in translation (DUF1610 family)
MSKQLSSQELDVILASKGYAHPQEAKPISNNNPYSSFSNNEYLHDIGTSPYSTFDNLDTQSNTRECPSCGTEALYRCNCDLHEMECKNGHIWYFDKSGKLEKSDPHK